MSLNEGIAPSDWTMERVTQWLKAKPQYAYLEPLFIGTINRALFFFSIHDIDHFRTRA